MKTNLPTPEGKVIQIETLRENRRMRQLIGNCPHTNLTIHHLDGLCCKDCGRQIDSTAWIIEYLEALEMARREQRGMQEEAKKLEAKKRVKCVHCQQMTPVRLG